MAYLLMTTKLITLRFFSDLTVVSTPNTLIIKNNK